MKQNLFNKLWLRVGMIVAIMTTALAGTVKAANYSYTFSAQQFTDNGTKALGNVSWTLAGDGGYWGYDGTKGQQFGSGSKPYKSLTLTTTGISGTITSIVVNASTASSATATISCTVGGNDFGTQSQSLSTSATNYTFSGNASGTIVISMAQTTKKALYVKSIVVTYTTGATTHSLTYSASTGGSLTVGSYTSSPATVEEGATVNISATPNTGYVFNNWTVSGTGSSVADASSASTTFTMGTENATLTANFTQVQTYTVTYHANVTGTADIEVEYNEGVDVTVASNTFANSGYVFTKWNTSADGNGTDYLPGATIDDIDDDIDLYAQWEELTYDFTQIDFTGWGSYAEHTVTFSDAEVYFASASKQAQGQTIDNQPVTKGGNVELKLTDGSTMSKVTFYCTQWGTKAQTITLHYSTDGGTTYDDFDPAVTSSNFTISKDNLPTGTNAVKITFSSTDNQVGIAGVYIEKIVSTVPSITASDVNIAYGATGGSFDYTINNPVQGGSVDIDFESDGDWLLTATEDNGTVNFTCEANNTNAERLGYVEITYNYGNNESVTKEVWVTQAAAPVIYSTIPALFDKATEVGTTATDVLVTFDSWIVSGVSTNGKNVFVTDNSGKGFVIYYGSDMRETFAAGKILSGTAVSCKVQLYKGYAEVTNLDASDLTITTGGTVSVANVAMASLAGDNTGALVHYENLTCSINNNKYYLSDGTTTIQVYNSLFAFEALTSGTKYNITGVYQQFDETKEILPRSAADIEEYVDNRDEAEIAFSVATLTFTEGDTYTAPTFSNPNSVDVTFSTTDGSVASWNNGLVLGGSTGTATITATFDGDANYKPATATLVVTINEDLGFATVKVGSGVYQKITSTSELEAGKRYLIVYWDGTSDDAEVFGGVISSNIGARVTLSIAENKINNNVADAATPVVLQDDGLGNWYIMDGDEFLYWTSGNNLYSSSDVNQNGNTWSIDVDKITNATTTGRRLQYNTGSPRFACYTGTQKDVVLYKELPVTVTLNGYGYATFSSANAVSIPADGAFTAWQITNIDNDNKITFVQVTGNVKAGTGLFLKGTASDEITIETAASGAELQDNILVGFPTATNVTAGEYYGLSGNQFKKVGDGTVKAGKALLPAHLIYESNSVKPFTFVFEEDDATAIEMVNGQSSMVNGPIYNVAGQRISKMQKGINIVNGKKIAVK